MTLEEVRAMTPEEKREKLAELMDLDIVGTPFIPVQVNPDAYFTDRAAIEWRKCYPNAKPVKRIPDYCNDLNAVHEVEKELTESQALYYQESLYIVGTKDARIASRYLWQATADQRTTALILTLSTQR